MILGDLLINNKSILKDKKYIICDGNKKRYNENFFGCLIKNPNSKLAKNIKTILCFSTFYKEIL